MKQRITLSPITSEDIDFIVDIKTNASLWLYDEITTDKDVVKRDVINRLKSDWYKQYIVKLNNDEKTPIGEFHIHWYTIERRSWEIGFCIFPMYRQQGYCTEAAKIALDYAFNDFGAHKVVAMCNEYNNASYRVMEKIGMTKEAIFREEYLWQEKWINQLFYCMLEHEYKNTNNF